MDKDYNARGEGMVVASIIMTYARGIVNEATAFRFSSKKKKERK